MPSLEQYSNKSFGLADNIGLVENSEIASWIKINCKPENDILSTDLRYFRPMFRRLATIYLDKDNE